MYDKNNVHSIRLKSRTSCNNADASHIYRLHSEILFQYQLHLQQ